MTNSLDTLTCKQVAQILHTSEAGLAQMRYRGVGPKFCRVANRKVIYTRQHVEEYLAANTIQRTDDPRGAA